ncbi:MAG: deoxynucleoside kinase [Erysipelotrichaceae bacterium]|nr:deoxynucleoside kinase [Erysipelotrichaceae bacterium]
MKILLFGVSNVGKTTVGKLLADRLGFRFYDLDEEVKRYMNMTLEEFVHTGSLRWRDGKRGRVIKKLIRKKEDMVFAVSPVSYTESFKMQIESGEDLLLIELYDTPENIFDRLVFSDENDNIYKDDEYKNKRRNYYLKEIQEDLNWYGRVYADLGVENRVFINNDLPMKTVDRIIAEYGLK